MAIGLIFAGIFAGFASAIAVLMAGGSVLAAFGAYTLAGMLCVLAGILISALPRLSGESPLPPSEGFQQQA